MVSEMARLLQLPLEKDCQKAFLHLEPTVGEGTVAAYHTNKGLDSILFDVQLARPVQLIFTGRRAQPIMLFTVASGAVQVTCAEEQFRVATLQSTIHGAYGPGAYRIELPANQPLRVLLSSVHRKSFFDQIACGVLDLPPTLLDVVKGNYAAGHTFLFQDIVHLPAVDCVHSITNCDNIGLLHSTHASAQIYENMFALFSEYKRINQRSNPRVIRHADKINTIQAAEEVLLSNLRTPPTIPELARTVGINQQTLKMGFRQLYGMTINQFVNNHRLERASKLITSSGLSIAEVADIVGYSNGGYFARRFKQKYGVNPSQFQATFEAASA